MSNAKNQKVEKPSKTSAKLSSEFDAGSPDLDVTKREAGLEQNDKSKSRITQTLQYDRNEVTDSKEDEQHRQAIREATGNRRDDMASGRDQVDKL